MEIHQMLANLDYGDAISNYSLEIQGILREKGYRSNIYICNAAPEMKKHCKPFTHHKKSSSKNNIIIFHYSIGSDVSQYVHTAQDKIILAYHNITPNHFFKGFNEALFFLTGNGRKELKEFRDIPILSLADSEFNAMELKELGFKNVEVLPIIVNFEKFNKKTNPSVLKKFSDGYVNLMFVGRIVPNKKYEDIIKTFYFYKKYINPKSRLLLVGSHVGMENYYDALVKLVSELDLTDVIFTGKVPHEDLIAYYQLGSVFLCMSEHEGFCIPLLEAMHFKIPILAYNSTGVPFTLGDGGILLKDKNYVEIAELIDYLQKNPELHEKVIKKQLRRLEYFETNNLKEKILKLIEKAKYS